jgi:pyrroline-5-carboxylate reductase
MPQKPPACRIYAYSHGAEAVAAVILTLLFTDVVAPADLGGDAEERARREHLAMVRSALQDHDGAAVVNLGDGLLVTFHSATAGVLAAMAIQQAAADHASGAIPSRVAVLAGEPGIGKTSLAREFSARPPWRSRPGPRPSSPTRVNGPTRPSCIGSSASSSRRPTPSRPKSDSRGRSTWRAPRVWCPTSAAPCRASKRFEGDPPRRPNRVSDVSPKLVVMGGGRMGEALVAGLLAAGWAASSDVVVVEAIEARRKELAGSHPGLQVASEPVTADGAVIAVKPGDVEAACRQLAPAAPGRVLSIAAGVTLSALEGWLGGGVPVVRAMPNTPALVGAGAAAVAAGTSAGDADLAWAEEVLGAVGIVLRVSEPLLDAVTGLSGSGPAYVFLVAEALIDAGVLAGLPRDVSTRLAIQTLLGSARMLAESGDGPEALRAMVTSPGGTTAAGLRVLEDKAVRSAFLEAVAAATERSRQLGS